MKNKSLPKSLLLAAVTFSFCCFLFVNLHARFSPRTAGLEKKEITAPVKVEEDKEESRNISVPDITILSRLIEIAQKFTLATR